MGREFDDDTKTTISKWKSWLNEKKSQGKTLRKDQLLIVLLSGVLLLVIGFPIDNKKTESAEPVGEQSTGLNLLGETEKETIINMEAAQEAGYTEEMEKKLEQVLSNMEHVGKVEVLITLKASEEKVVEKDTPVNRSNTEEQDSEGGSRSVSNVDTQETTIYETDSGKSTPYVVKTTSPQVEGVLVVCEGAGVGTVSENITDAIEVLFGIEPHKIKVVKMKTS